MTDSLLLEVQDLNKSYTNGFCLNHISFSLHNNEVMALLGPNGAGKTTCIKLLCSLINRDSGLIGKAEGRSEGFMSEDISIWPDLTCREQIELTKALYGRSASRHRLKKTDEILEEFNLSKYAQTQGIRLSLGNKRKLSFLLSVIHTPDILILDEPFGGLDTRARKETVQWIKEYASGENRAVIISSHQMDEVQNCADRLLIMEKGSILCEVAASNVPGNLDDFFHKIIKEARS